MRIWSLLKDQTVDGYRYMGVENYHANRRGHIPSVIVISTPDIDSAKNLWKSLHQSNHTYHTVVDETGQEREFINARHGAVVEGECTRVTARGQDILEELGPDISCYTLSLAVINTGEITDDQVVQAASVVSRWMEQYDIPLSYVIRHFDINASEHPCTCSDVHARIIELLREG